MIDWKSWDEHVLLSWTNTKLRDVYEDLNALCEDLEIDRFELEEVLSGIGTVYAVDQNRFVCED